MEALFPQEMLAMRHLSAIVLLVVLLWTAAGSRAEKPGDHQMMKAAPKDIIDRVLKKADFNDYEIRCVGKHVTIKLNGATTVDDDFPGMHDDGIIAWQIHSGPPMEVSFRNIQFKELP